MEIKNNAAFFFLTIQAIWISFQVITERDRLEILQNPWTPDISYSFPRSGKRNLKFQHNWFNRWKWLLYSKFSDGAYCKYCALFCCGSGVGRGYQALGVLVQKPFRRWKDAVEQFNLHESTEYHKQCVLKAENLRSVAKGKQKRVDLLQNSVLESQIEENRKAVLPIISTILFCGRQGIALRGHKDWGPLTLSEDTVCNDGNFRALLRFRVEGGDTSLKTHLEKGSRNALYLSPTFQNEVVSACNNLVLGKLVDMVNSAECFTVLADETTDISTTEQFSIGVRYIFENKIREDFLQFVVVSDVTGKNLANVLLSSLEKFGVKVQYLRGQGYDGASAMSGKFNGVQAHVHKTHPCALYVHCAAHSLNLALSASCTVTPVRNVLGTATKICTFFNTAKRCCVLQQSIHKLCPQSKATRLKQLCPTRWIERHDAIILLGEMLVAVHDALGEITNWTDTDTSSMALQLHCAIEQPTFLVCLQVLAIVFSISLPLCRFLQSKDTDLAAAINMVSLVDDELQSLRRKAETEFKNMYNSATEMAEKFGVEMCIPRITGRQTHRCNVEVKSAEEYFRISVFLPFLNFICNEMNQRFLTHKEILSSFACLLPDGKSSSPTDEHLSNMKKLTIFYEEDLQSSSSTTATGELKLWYRHIAQLSEKPKNAIDYYLECNQAVFPAINRLLKILATLPISTSTSERSFSTLRRIKTYLRNTTGEERLNGLALLNVHREIQVSPDEILNILAQSNRRLNFKLN